jgi:hypothetical protein
MCLLTTQQVPQIAEEDIICYKILTTNTENGQYESYYYSEMKWELNKLYSTSLGKCKNNNVLEGFHSYAHYQDALKILEQDMPLGCMLVKCTIPKEAKYYKGKQQDSDGYASNQIKMTEIIKKKGELIINDDTYPYKRTDELELQIKAKYNNCLKYTDLIHSIYKYNGQYHIITSLFHIITNEKGELLTNYYKTIQITHISHVEK